MPRILITAKHRGDLDTFGQAFICPVLVHTLSPVKKREAPFHLNERSHCVDDRRFTSEQNFERYLRTLNEVEEQHRANFYIFVLESKDMRDIYIETILSNSFARVDCSTVKLLDACLGACRCVHMQMTASSVHTSVN